MQEDSESEADVCQQNQIETNVNDYEKNIIPGDLLPVAYGIKTLTDTKFRPELLSLLHDDSHLGIDKCIQRAEGSVYWPNILEDIKSVVNKCEKCLANCGHNQKEPYIPFDIPIVAWKTVATDLFVFQDKTYLVVVDLFSRFPVIR